MTDPINSGEAWASIRGKINSLMADLTAAVASVAGKLTGSNNLSDLPDKAAARTALELGTMAQQNAGAVAITGGTITGGAISGVSISGLAAPLPIASGGTGGGTQDAAQTALGATALGKSLFAAANPGAARTALEVAAAVDTLLKSGNFSGLADVDASLGNLGFSAFVRGLRTAADQAAFRTALGLGGMAIKSNVAFADLVAAAVRLSSEGLATPTDAELATAAWAKAYADSLPRGWVYAGSFSTITSGGIQITRAQLLSGSGLSDYSDLMLQGASLTASLSGARMLRVSTDNGGTFLSTGIYIPGNDNGTLTQVELTGATTQNALSPYVDIMRVGTTDPVKPVRGTRSSENSAGVSHINLASVINAFRIFNAAGNITGGAVHAWVR